jgi:hypothetical protein
MDLYNFIEGELKYLSINGREQIQLSNRAYSRRRADLEISQSQFRANIYENFQELKQMNFDLSQKLLNGHPHLEVLTLSL